MIASSWNLLLVLAHSDGRTTAAAGGSLLVSLLWGLPGSLQFLLPGKGSPEGGCDLSPTKLTDESKVEMERNVSEEGLTPLEGVKPHKVLKPAAAADGPQGGCVAFGPYLSTSKLLRKKTVFSEKGRAIHRCDSASPRESRHF